MSAFNQNVNLCGLTSYSVAVPNAAPYALDWKISLPTVVNGGGQSAVVMTVTNTTQSTTIYTGIAGAEGGSVVTSCAANDVLQFALTSAAAPDQGLNTIKATIAIAQGV